MTIQSQRILMRFLGLNGMMAGAWGVGGASTAVAAGSGSATAALRSSPSGSGC